MKQPEDCNDIAELREGIDEIDSRIIGLIGNRLSFVREIAKYKTSSSEVYSPGRHNEVIKKLRDLATSYDLDPDIIENVYRILMEYFIKEQMEILKEKGKE